MNKTVQDLETPFVMIDIDVMDRNLTRLGAYCRDHGIHLRPHTKTHKIPDIAKRQLASGATGITVAKVGEAEVMVDSGITDLLIAYPIVSPPKAARLAKLADRAQITVSLDSEEAAQNISEAAREHNVKVGLLVEMDVGLRRCGVADEQAALALARKITEMKGVEFRGLMFYPGNIFVKPEEQKALLIPLNAKLDRAYEAFRQAGIPIKTVSGGSTPTAYITHEFHGVTEIRPGMYLFNDRNMFALGVARLEDCALSVIVTVVSTAVPGRAIVDGGSKTFSSDRFLVGNAGGYGLIKEDPDASLETMSEEHGHLDISRSKRKYRIGERLTIIPNHVCATVNMHDEIYGTRGGQVEVAWQVAGRGKIR